MAILVRESRPDKLIEISADELKQRQVVRLTPDEAQTLTEHWPALNASRVLRANGVQAEVAKT